MSDVRVFDRLAPMYEALSFMVSGTLYPHWINGMVRTLGHPEGDWLDIGCGTGWTTFLLKRRSSGRKVTGLDISGPMLAIARQKRDSRKDERGEVEFVDGSGLDIPMDDGSFDGIVSTFGMRNVGDPPRAFSEMFRVLRPGGEFAFLDVVVPPDSLWSDFLEFYLQRVMTRVAGMFGVRDAYAHFNESILEFPYQDEVARLLHHTGFHNVSVRPLFFPFIAIARGVRPHVG